MNNLWVFFSKNFSSFRKVISLKKYQWTIQFDQPLEYKILQFKSIGRDLIFSKSLNFMLCLVPKYKVSRTNNAFYRKSFRALQQGGIQWRFIIQKSITLPKITVKSEKSLRFVTFVILSVFDFLSFFHFIPSYLIRKLVWKSRTFFLQSQQRQRQGKELVLIIEFAAIHLPFKNQKTVNEVI